MKKTISELFAGVGGFRLGFERLGTDWETVWFNQFEPGTKKQWAHECYVKHFGDCKDINGEYHTNEDICTVNKSTIPDHSLLVAGFPCQDYSVAKSSAEGIEGKKGVLWWQIYEILKEKQPPFCIFENVDRLIKSPTKQRGRDFGIILDCLAKLGYCAEWRIVNAAKYGSPQKRKRIFIFAYRADTAYELNMKTLSDKEIIGAQGFMAKAFPVTSVSDVYTTTLNDDIATVSDNFSFDFQNAGYMRNNTVYTAKVIEKESAKSMLFDVLEENADAKYEIPDDKFDRWKYLKGAKKIPRKSKTGYEYIYSEGAVPFPDKLNQPARTLLTSEASVNRSSHVVYDIHSEKLRTLTPVETERLQGFDDNWTNTGMTERMRYFCMGNSLVVPMVTRMAKVLDDIIKTEKC